MTGAQFDAADINYLLSPAAIRAKSLQIYDLSLAGQGQFKINMERLEHVSDYVLAVIKDNYPDLNIPFHSRWGHFGAGNIDRLTILNNKLAGLSELDRARAKLDLVLVSVLLDAGAGEDWHYVEASSGQTYSRSEGLAIASFNMFLEGAFSSDEFNPLQVDAKALMKFNSQSLFTGFQVNDKNPLTGVQGRVNLMQALGEVLDKNSAVFINNRPGNLLDALIKTHGVDISAENILNMVLTGFGDIWPGRISLGETNLGDVWQYSPLTSSDPLSSLVPFHKLSQWLTYSMIEPIVAAGINVSGVEKLTGLAEYRNGGLLIDQQLIELKNNKDLHQAHLASSALIVEWRALTIILLDKIADNIRGKLSLSASELPLAKVLEGGTWRAGRKAAKEIRADGSPPLKLASDGTVF